MNGISSLPKFLEGEPLPCGYLEPINPYVDPPVCNFNLGALLNYAEKQGKKCWDLTKEEVAQFRTFNKNKN